MHLHPEKRKHNCQCARAVYPKCLRAGIVKQVDDNCLGPCKIELSAVNLHNTAAYSDDLEDGKWTQEEIVVSYDGQKLSRSGFVVKPKTGSTHNKVMLYLGFMLMDGQVEGWTDVAGIQREPAGEVVSSRHGDKLVDENY